MPVHEYTEINIPFDGFYDSYHSDEIDRALGHALCSDPGDFSPDPLLFGVFWWSHRTGHWADRRPQVDYASVHEAYGREFAENYLLRCCGLPYAPGYAYRVPVRGAVDSPREYNFTADRLFMEVETRYLMDMLIDVAFDEDAWLHFEDAVRERFTSRSGFISSYPADVEEWPEEPARDWDHNHWRALIVVWVEHFGDPVDYEVCLMEDASGNGLLDNLIHENANDDARRLFDLAHNLLQRREREAASSASAN